MKRHAFAVALALFGLPALAEPYRPLPRYPSDKVKERTAGARAVQKAHQQSPEGMVVAEPAPANEQVVLRTGETEEEIHVIAIPPLPENLQATPRARRTAPLAPPAVAAPLEERRDAGASTQAKVAGANAAQVDASEGPAPSSPGAKTKLAASDLKVSVGQARSDGQFVMLVEDPSGVRIELTLDGGGHLLDVRPAGTFQ